MTYDPRSPLLQHLGWQIFGWAHLAILPVIWGVATITLFVLGAFCDRGGWCADAFAYVVIETLVLALLWLVLLVLMVRRLLNWPMVALLLLLDLAALPVLVLIGGLVLL